MNQIVFGSQAASERPFFWNPCASGHDGLPEIRDGSWETGDYLNVEIRPMTPKATFR